MQSDQIAVYLVAVKVFRPLILQTHPLLRWMVRLSILSALATVAFYPWVMDFALWYYLKGQSVTAEIRQVNYSGIQYSGLNVDREGTTISIGSVSVPSVVSLAGMTGKSRPVVIHDVSIDLSEQRRGESQPESDLTLSGLLGTLFNTLPRLESVLPAVRLNGLTLTLSAGNQFVIEQIQWRAGQLKLLKGRWDGDLPEQWNNQVTKPQLEYLSLGRLGPQRLHYLAEFSENLMLDGTLVLNEAAQPLAALRASWEAGQLDLNADWNATDWLPAECSLTASGTGFPFLEKNPAAPFDPYLQIVASYDLQSETFSLEVNGSGNYQLKEAGQSTLPWGLSILALGNPDTVQFSALVVDLPGLKANLGNDLVLDRSNWVPSNAACFTWDLDLAASPFPGLEGVATGTVCLDPAKDRQSAVFTISGTAADLLLPSHVWPERIQQVKLSGEGSFDAQNLQARVLEVSASGLLDLTGQLTWDWQAKLPASLDLQGSLKPELISRWLPPEQVALSSDGIAVNIQAENGAEGWEHAGSLSTTAATLREDFQVDLSVKWQGWERLLERWSVELDHDDIRLSGDGSLEWKPDQLDVLINQLQQESLSGVDWSLDGSASLVFSPKDTNSPASLNIGPLGLTFKNGGMISLLGRWSGWSDLLFEGSASNLGLSSLDAWIDNPRLASLTFEQLTFSIRSQSGQAGRHAWSGSGSIKANWLTRDNLVVAGEGGWSITDSQTEFSQLVVEVDGTKWFTIDGVLPVSFHGSPQQPVAYQISADDPLEIQLELQPVETLPRLLADRLPFKIENLQARAVASGTLSRPEAEIVANAGKLSWQRSEDETVYAVNDLLVDAEIGVDSLGLRRLSVRLPDAEKPESMRAEVSNVDWVGLVENARDYPWNDLAGYVTIDRWPVVSLGSILPREFQPQGQFSVNFTKKPGQWPIGELNFKGLSWRSLDAGIIARDIAGKAHLQGRQLDELQMTASVGGGIVRIAGWMDFAELRDPRFRIGLQSDRFDLVRRSNFILRGRSDIEAVYEASDAVPRLQGEIELIRSLWLRDLQDFTRKGVAGVSQRPPYFALKTQPFADWQLDLNLFGDNFLRLQSTILTGTASTEFKLRGTLGNPLMVGNVTLSDGAIIFPFARLKTTGIEAWITEDEPHTIKLSGSGDGVVYGYIVQYHLSGTSEMPAITFTSIPSLPQQDILLMLTTGAVPSADLTANINERTQRIGFFIGQDIFSSLIGQDGASKLEFRTGDGFSPFRRESQLLEYQISDKWSILGEYDDFGGYNVDVRRILLQR